MLFESPSSVQLLAFAMGGPTTTDTTEMMKAVQDAGGKGIDRSHLTIWAKLHHLAEDVVGVAKLHGSRDGRGCVRKQVW